MGDARLFSTVRQLISSRDPKGLLEMGARQDECGSEVRDRFGLVRGGSVITADPWPV
ncbi:hypothetical protein [Actinomadura sp. KC216]|uniref:hypothetical protein n=1 Tax=Actinomadura sp. KC216 TaxID=2530370 RepID=UPI00140469C8|nr:hypothetical protein [Actinomadura sp. KC216]